MSINWSNVGSTLSSIATTLSNLNITGTTANSILASIGLAANPNESVELAICKQILTYSALGPAGEGVIAKLAETLATEQGIPTDAGALALTLTQPGVNIAQTVLQIEQLINQGG